MRRNSGTECEGSPEWRPAAASLREYRENAGKPAYLRSLTANPPGGGPNPNLPGFTNSGGLLGKGVCWWHSRFTRNALYLAYFRPGRPCPGAVEAGRIISSLMKARRVTPVPGYSCLRDFTLDHREAVQKELEKRQMIEGLFRFAWINGLSGCSSASPSRLGELVEEIRAESAKGLVYAKFQTSGLDAHSIVVTGTERLQDVKDCLMRYLDSNSLREETVRFRYGQRRLELASGMKGVPFPQRSRELTGILMTVRRFPVSSR